MRIAIDARKIESPLTGIGRYTKNLLTHISMVDKDNHYIVLWNKNSPREMIQAENFRTVMVNYPAFSIRSLFFLHRILHREKIDVFHSPFISAPLLARCKIIVTVHDLIPLRFPRSFEKSKNISWFLRKLIFQLFFLIATKRAKSIIADSWDGKRALESLDGCLVKKTQVIYVAPEEIFKRISQEEIGKTKAGFGLEGKLILYVGAIRPHKNLVILLNALNLLIREKKQQCYLVICGGKEADFLPLKEITEKLGTSRNVFFVGSLNDTKVVALMNAADVFVFPSLEEGFGLPPLEAMACGTPVITSNLSSLPEVVGDAALLVDPCNVHEIANAIERLLLDEKLRNELIKRGFERVKRFSWERTVKETLQVYEAVITKNNKM